MSRLVLIAVTIAMASIKHLKLAGVWNEWDTRWYLGIATHGYHWSLHGKSALAFFPLYPLLVHCISSLGLPSALGGLIVSNVAFAAALVYFFLFTEREWGGETASRATWLLALFPTSFFTFAPYTESLFLLCAIASLYHARRHQLVFTGLWLAFALGTRSTGVIVIPAAMVALERYRWHTRLMALAPAGVALGCYGSYLAGQHLSLAGVLTAQRAWHRAFSYPWTGFQSSVSWLADHGAHHPAWSLENAFSLGVTLLFLGLTVKAWRALGRTEALYCGAFWLVVLTSPEWMDGYYAPFSSMDRFVFVLFPLAAWLAPRTSPQTFRRLLACCAVLMSCFAVLHLSGGWVG